MLLDIKKNDDYYKELFDNAFEPILLLKDDKFIDANKAALKAFEMNSLEDLALLHPSQLSPKYQPDGQDSHIKANEMMKLCLQKSYHRFDWLHQTINKKEFWVDVTLKAIEINSETLIHVAFRDIEDKKKIEEDLKAENRLLNNRNNFFEEIYKSLKDKEHSDELFDSLFLLQEYKKAIDESSIVSKANKDGIITYVNEKFCEVSGYDKEDLLGKTHNIVKHEDNSPKLFEDLWNTILSKKIYKGIIKNKTKNGKAYFVDSTIIPILNKDGEISEFMSIRHDITSIFEKDKLIKQQFTDGLTLLSNRQKLLNDIDKNILPKLAILNIDRFKDLNDSYSIEIGDEILREVSSRLILFKKPNLNLYRIAGDVFAFLAFGNFPLNSLKQICEEVNTDFERTPICIDENSFNISFTIGISSQKDKLLTHAEVAHLYAKQTSKDLIVFDPNLPLYKKLKENIELTKSIKTAIENDKVLIYGQKILSNTDDKIKYETLMRIELENKKVLSPFFFLDQAKKARLYPLMTQTIIDKACEYFKDKDYVFSINLMLEDIKNLNTINFLFNKLKETNTASKIIIEIVESEGIEEFEEVSSFIKQAKALGCSVAIDDFGTGYSNFEYIIKLNVDILKIDGSLIKNIHIDKNVRLTVSTIVNFAKVLGISVVAEFVHCQEVQDIVKEMGIEFSQGFLFDEPKQLI